MTAFHRLARIGWFCLFCLLSLEPGFARAGVSGGIDGRVRGPQGTPLAGVWVQATGQDGRSSGISTTADGSFSLTELPFGDYSVSIAPEGLAPYRAGVSVGSGTVAGLDAQLQPLTAAAEDVGELDVTVRADRIRINRSAAVSSQEEDQRQIAQLPGGATQPLPKLLYSTNPGFVEGSFGQVFARGNHANLQYDIDGIQLPDSVSGTFGDAFSVLDIDRMEVITGGLPAEYGNRLSGVVNILTKSGGLEPGGTLDLNYGSFNTFSPELTYGGSTDGGHLRYFLSGSYSSTERGLDTPEPVSEGNQGQGGTDVVHDQSSSNNQFGKLDWDVDAQNTLLLTAFNAQKGFQIPNYPAGFRPTDPFFTPGYTDAYGNGNAGWSPAATDDYQVEGNDYAELMWKHHFADDSLLQLAPYWKSSTVVFHGDPSNDLASATLVPVTPAGQVNASSFFEDRTTTNLGLQADYSLKLNDANAVKAGFQLQAAEAHGPITVLSLSTGQSVTATSTDSSADHDYQESAYVQDDITILPDLVLNAGLRYDAIQFLFPDASSLDGMFQPRLGLNYTPLPTTKFHLYYGRLFQPAPAEDLRDTFANLGQGTLAPYDIKAEKDDYYEAGVAQQCWDQLAGVNVYYKDAVNLLDDTQLLNTAISEPYNFAQGFVYGLEASVNGRFLDHFTDFLTYSYEIAQGSGASGGLFALPPGTVVPTDWNYLDHCQINTANAGLTWSLGGFSIGATGLYGSGLRTGPNNTNSLPPHLSMDGTVSYAFSGSRWIEDTKLALDVTNIFDNVYPIFVDNGFNGSHYTAPTAFTFHLIKTL
jgi:outer membrane cobalamin receptor